MGVPWLLPSLSTLMNRLDDHTDSAPFEVYIRDKIDLKGFPASPSGCLTLFASTLFPQAVALRTATQSCQSAKSTRKNKESLKHMQRQVRARDEKKRKEEERLKKEEEEDRLSQGKARLLDLDEQSKGMREYVPHPCVAACVARWERSIKQVKFVNPLLMPLLHGWRRLICHQYDRNSGKYRKNKRWVKYEAPCGRQLRNTGEVDKYLSVVNSWLTIDQFSFDSNVVTNREYEANACFLKIEDFSDGKEIVPISAVNCNDSQKPDEIDYQANRIPLDGVPLDVSGDELVGCDCVDGCRDRTKCACWLKTLEATEFSPYAANGTKSNTNIGYRGRRLPEIVHTGIFECNSKCKCDCRCSNRVVQNGISVRLQLFKTKRKGWGLRCLDDIAKGTFICIYAGHLLTEEQSDQRGLEIGDEYFAELDFVDIIRKNNLLNAFDSSVSATSSSSDSETGALTTKPEIDCIFLDSDEDEQDVAARDRSLFVDKAMVTSVQDKEAARTLINYNISRLTEYRKKIERRSHIIDSNRFFTDPNNKFFYQKFLDERKVFIMDAKLSGNIGRFFNHSCTPNIYVQNVFVDTYDLRFPWIAFFSSENISAGTELCWDYHYEIGSVQGREMYCYCRTRNCRGRLL